MISGLRERTFWNQSLIRIDWAECLGQMRGAAAETVIRSTACRGNLPAPLAIGVPGNDHYLVNDTTFNRCSLWLILATVVLLVRCGADPETAPDLTGLKLGMSYPAAVTLARGECEHVHDRGVRQLEWHYEDGSLVTRASTPPAH